MSVNKIEFHGKLYLNYFETYLLKFFWTIFAVLDRKTQNCSSKTSNNEFENFINIVKF